MPAADRRDIEQQLRDAIREFLAKSGWNLTQLQRKHGIDHAAVWRFLNLNEPDKPRTITLALAAKLCRVLGLHLCHDPAATPLGPPPEDGRKLRWERERAQNAKKPARRAGKGKAT